MRSYALVEHGADLQPVDAPDPVPQGTEVLIRMRRCGVCHSDIHIAHGYFDMGGGQKFHMSERGVAPPLTLGHEVLGEVISAGPDAGDVPVGETMLVHPWIGCMDCPACNEDRENDCVSMQALGIIRDGGYATHMIVPHPKFLVDVSGIDLDLAAPYACSGLTVYSALKKVLPVRSDEWLAIMGAGGLGLTAISVARALGAENILVVDVDDAKLDAAKALGADAVFNSSREDGDLTAATGGMLLAVLDTVGVPATAQLGVQSLRKTGRLVTVGLHGGAVQLPLVALAQKAIMVRGSYVGSCAELRELIALVRDGKIAPIPVEVRDLERADETLKDLEAGRIVGRVVLSND